MPTKLAMNHVVIRKTTRATRTIGGLLSSWGSRVPSSRETATWCWKMAKFHTTSRAPTGSSKWLHIQAALSTLSITSIVLACHWLQSLQLLTICHNVTLCDFVLAWFAFSVNTNGVLFVFVSDWTRSPDQYIPVFVMASLAALAISVPQLLCVGDLLGIRLTYRFLLLNASEQCDIILCISCMILPTSQAKSRMRSTM